MGTHVEVPVIVTDSSTGCELLNEFVLSKREPAILRGFDFGNCRTKWTWDYLQQACGSRKVKVHVSPSPQMDFITKNFVYRTLTFAELIQRVQLHEQSSFFVCKEEKYYLRSLGEDSRADVADIRRDFPELSADVSFPPLFDPERFFSSVLRISSPGVQLWTHYDVMDNFLMMVSGLKRVVLFRPTDALFMYLQDDKSQVLDIDNPDPNLYPDFQRAIRYECVLQPGDILFIPALWFHNVVNVDGGVAVNVFWRHLAADQYDKSDTYGNKDLVSAARAGQIVDRAIKLLETLPDDYRDFYARTLIARIQSRACKHMDA